MKRALMAAAFIAASVAAVFVAVAGPNDMVVQQRNSNDNGQQDYVLWKPAAGANGIVYFDGTNQIPAYLLVGSGLSVSSGALTASTTPRSFNHTTRSLNSCFQVSSTRDALVTYSVDISATLSLTTGQVGTVYLRTYTNSGCSTGTQEITRFVNGNSGSLTIGLNLTQNVTGTLTGVLPAGVWAQLVTENTTGTPTFTARPGQETLL